QIAYMDPHGADLWEIICLLRSEVPAPQVIGRLKQVSHIVSTVNVDGAPGDLSITPKPSVWGEEGQRTILRQLKHDPILAVFGLRPKYLCSLLRRLLVEVEAQGLPVVDELADAYGEALMHQPDQTATSAATGPSASSQWLFKTFAYGPAATTAATSAPQECREFADCIGGFADISVKPSATFKSSIYGSTESQHSPPIPVLQPIPSEVTRSHVAAIISELQRRKDTGDSSARSGAGPVVTTTLSGHARAPGLPLMSKWELTVGAINTDSGFSSETPVWGDQMLTDGIGSDNREVGNAEARGGVGQPGGTDAAGGNHRTLPALLRYPLVSASSEIAECSVSKTPQHVSAGGTCVAGKGSDGGWQAYSAEAVLAAAVAPGDSDGHNGECGLISLHVSDNLLAGSTGCHVWEASFALAQWVLGHSERFRGRRVLELGCGAGLVAMALHRAGAAWVAATDGSDAAVANCAANLRLNGVRGVHLMQSGAGKPPGHQVAEMVAVGGAVPCITTFFHGYAPLPLYTLACVCQLGFGARTHPFARPD
ncbi:hypothetical protein VaNZ11_000146, partial [Volvox africanus]